MKKFAKIFCFGCILTLSMLVMFACGQSAVEAKFKRFSIGNQQSNNYYLDYTIDFDNQTKSAVRIEENDFYAEVNGEQKTTISFWYEYEEVFYAHPTLNAGEKLTLRVRVISTVNNKQYNSLLLKYNDKVLVDDNIYISGN